VPRRRHRRLAQAEEPLMGIFTGAFGTAEKRLEPEFAARDEDPDV
jgi:hypothetical protein